MDEKYDQDIFLIPDMMSWIHEDFKGGWMLDDSNPFQVVFDKRNQKKLALMTEFNSEDSFQKDTNIWTDKPYILGWKEVKQQITNNSVIYHMSRQRAIMHIISEYDQTRKQSKTTFRFFQDHLPYKELNEEKSFEIRGKRARATMLRDLRTETDQFQMNTFRIVIDGRHEDTMVKF